MSAASAGTAAPRSDLETLVSDYCRAWHHPDPDERRRLIEASLTADCLYMDPTVRVEGQQALLAHIETVLARRPGFALERLGPVDSHHDMLRFGWRMRLAGDRTGPECLDVCRISPDGRLALIVGFFGPIPAAAPGQADPRAPATE